MFKLFRKKTNEITQISEWNNTMGKIIVLLSDNSHNAQSEWVREIKESLCSNDKKDFIKKLNSVNMWGGSGAVWEVGNFRTFDEAKEFGKQIIRLVQLMKADKISHGKAKSVSRYFKKEYNL